MNGNAARGHNICRGLYFVMPLGNLRQIFVLIVLCLCAHLLGATCPQPYFYGFSSVVAPLTLASDPIVAANDDGHLEVFVLGMDGSVWHSWQDLKGIWSAWVPFPNPPGTKFSSLLTCGGFEACITYPQLAAVKDSQGRLQLFIADGVTVWQVGQASKNVNWNSWQKLSLSTSTWSPIGVWAAPNADGHPELFVLDQFKSKLVHFWQFNNQPNWNGPAEFDLPQSAGGFGVDMSVAVDSMARIAVGVVGSDGGAYVRRQQVPSGGWGGWEEIGKPSGVQLVAGTARFAANADKRLELMAAGNSGAAYWHTWEVAAKQWVGIWSSFGAFSPGPGFDSQLIQGKGGCLTGLAAVRLADGTSDRTINVTQQQPSSGWNGWSGSLLGNFQRVTGHMAVGKDIQGRLVVYMRGIDGNIKREVSNYE